MKRYLLLFAIYLMTGTATWAQSDSKTVKLPLNTQKREMFPSITDDGKNLFFASDRNGKLSFFLSQNKRGSWSEPEELIPTSSLDNITAPFVSYDGKMIVFSATKETRTGTNSDLYYIEKYGKRLGKVQPFDLPINTDGHEMFPSLSADGKSLYFARVDAGADYLNITYSIYVSEKDQDGKWQEPVKLPAPVNIHNEKAPRILADNKTLLFSAESSTGNKDFDVYATVKQDGGTWSTPQELTFINTQEDDLPPAIDLQSYTAIYSLNDDLVSFSIPEGELPTTSPVEIPVAIANNSKVQTRNVTEEDAWDMGDLDFDVKQFVKKPRYFALLIGVDEYQDRKIKSLDKPVHDATKLKEILTKYYLFEESNVTLLTNPTRADMVDALDALAEKVSFNDNLLIFYAGHGHWVSSGGGSNGVGYWLPSDAKKKSTANWFRNTTLKEYIGRIQAKHTLLVSDACFSGGIFKTRAAFDESEDLFAEADNAVRKLYELPSRKAMTSGALKEVPDESVFVKYLFKRLEDNKEKYLPAEVLFSSFKIAVSNNSPNVPQFGVIHDTGDEGGDFIFIKK
ncbi:caspase family protein [Limibacter armeniacum]|uniref:caspase family protein n=1 Tax=Limibacter armeniacum TaxID=466084 RepID=UPI002FE698D8